MRLPLVRVGFACRDDAADGAAVREDDNIEPPTDAAEQSEPRLAVVKTIIPLDMAIRISERGTMSTKAKPRSRRHRSLFAGSHSKSTSAYYANGL
jgi:hypothetical protein